MSAKDSAQLKKEIQSDSQKRLREKHVSLPYHKSKQRTLQEFLQKRTRFAAALPIKSNTPSIAMKMSRQQLEIMSKTIEEREKEVEEFFKSESESEPEEDIEETIPTAADVENLELTSITNTHDEDATHISQYILTEIINNIIDKTLEPNLCNNERIQNISDFDFQLTPREINTTLENQLEFTDVDSTDLLEKNIELEENHKITKVDDIKEMSDSSMVASTNLAEETKEIESKEKESKSDDVAEEITKSDNIPGEILESSINDADTSGKDHSIELLFNLDDFDDDDDEDVLAISVVSPTKEILEADKLKRLLDKFKDPEDGKSNEEEVDITELENVSRNETESLKTKTPMQILKESLKNSVPRLSDGPNHIIDLDADIATPSGVCELMERFLKHTTKKKPTKNKISLSVVSVTGGEIIQEKVAIASEDHEEPEIIEKPGTKIKKLRDDLQLQMAQRRSELWKQRQDLRTEKDEEEAMFEGEKSDCGADDDGMLDNDEEEEFTDPESSEQEEEIDEERPEKKKTKLLFADEEAEESDAEEVGIGADNDENDGDDEEGDDDEGDDDDKDDEENQDDKIDNTIESPKKPLRRIIEASDDSDDEDDNTEFNEIIKEIRTGDNELDSTDPWDDDDCLPPAQPRSVHTPLRSNRTETKSDLCFVSPICTLTGLQSLNSGSKFYQDTPDSPAVMLEPELSPIRGNTAQKKLFSDDLQTQSNLDDLADLCSGKFPTQTQIHTENHEQLIPNINEDVPFNTQDMLDICSGVFTGITQKPTEHAEPTTRERIQVIQNIILNQNEEIKSLGDDDEDKLISALLDEEEMERFKKKFVSPVVTATQISRTPEVSALAARIQFESSDEDEADEHILQIKKKNKTKNFVDSDDEEANDSAEEIDLHDDDDDNEEGGENNEDIAYDSEENEIELTEKIAHPRQTSNAADFFEQEAELSESEWGSADEDENDLDRLETELGDAEKFDDDKVKSDLEKIHMRRILDDDSKEVKMLQEMLLQDGELHGAGRQRQFRWKNIDSVNDENEAPLDEDGVALLDDDDEQTEEQWRKKRHEREIFLRKQLEHSQSMEDESDITIGANSQVLKLGQKALVRSISLNNTPIDNSKIRSSPDLKTSFLMNKRGSFLSRKDAVLNRVAEYNKVSSSLIGAPKNSKNFVFQTISPEENAAADKKRKAPSDGTPLALKKLRLNTLSPAVAKKTGKNNNRAKNLFNTNSW